MLWEDVSGVCPFPPPHLFQIANNGLYRAAVWIRLEPHANPS